MTTVDPKKTRHDAPSQNPEFKDATPVELARALWHYRRPEKKATRKSK